MKTSKKMQKRKSPSIELALPASKNVAPIASISKAHRPTSTDHIAGATVRIGLKREGQGVLVPGNLVLTAAHCIQWTTSGDMVLAEDEYLAVVSTPTGESFFLKIVAVDPASDIAVLGVPDNQTFPEHADRFEDWCEKTTPVRLCHLKLESGDSVEALVLTHQREWVSAEAMRHQFAPSNGRIWVEYEEPILGGTSGGPVITPDGRLLGVVSHVNDVNYGPCNGTIPLARVALPQWVLARIEEANSDLAAREHAAGDE